MIDTASLNSYFRQHMGGDVRVIRYKRTFPGISRETFLVWTEESGAEGGYVFRTDALGGPICPVPLEYEYRIIKGLHATVVPVAEPLWFEAAPAITDGRPVMVRRMVDGSNDLPGLYDEGAEAAARRQRIAFEHAEKLAALHTLDLDATGFSAFVDMPASAADCARADFDRWMRIFHEVRTDPFPLLTEAAFWLREHLPTTAPRISLCKGNNGMGEEIWKEDRIVALSDWELAFAGDPAQDWALSQGMLTLGDAEQTLRHYENAAGFTIDRSSLDFYRVWEVWKAVPTLNNGLRPFLSGENPRVPRLNLGFGRVKLFEQLLGMMIGKPIDEAARIVAEWRKSPYRPENAAN
ncbi:phosphotransferase family protein [Sandaracinobacter sp. RS1-74]|uniref:phosphotransferase family protein n=1 Tax=Sandaracinobacteroides sayramensis TaxID=2913411 RepID=UPI001EDC3CFE|nr:phosphotransferase family protein [Sandaracinobacteroides sayramensis]MCG2840938.1 phosphotransferase family protein [Sandaracinobacteroides sayramensis]